MGNNQEACDVCGSTIFPFFLKVGYKTICIDCKPSKRYLEIVNEEQERYWTKYICTTHMCETYSAQNMFVRHYMEGRCNVIEKVTLGLEKPSTVGGCNGDISKKHFYQQPDLDRLLVMHQNFIRYKSIQKQLRLKWTMSKEDSLGEIRPDISKADIVFFYNHSYFKTPMNVKVNTDNSRLDTLVKIMIDYHKDKPMVDLYPEDRKENKKSYGQRISKRKQRKLKNIAKLEETLRRFEK